MISPSEIKVGIVAEQGLDIWSALTCLKQSGCVEENIVVKYVPPFQLALGVLFFAEYTDVDGVIVVGEEFDTNIAKSLHELQIQWNMPVEYRYNGSKTGDDCGLVDMIQLQSEMAGELPEEKSPASRRENIN